MDFSNLRVLSIYLVLDTLFHASWLHVTRLELILMLFKRVETLVSMHVVSVIFEFEFAIIMKRGWQRESARLLLAVKQQTTANVAECDLCQCCANWNKS